MVYWLEEAGRRDPAPPLAGDRDADVVIVGAGYSGMWTAWALLDHVEAERIVVIEANCCGEGPSGRNAGFVNSFWHRLGHLADQFGDSAALEVCREASASVDAIGAWAEQRGADVWFRRGGHLKVASGPSQEGAWLPEAEACARLGEPGQYENLSPAEVAARCSSPRLGGGAFNPGGATVQPARLALALRDALLEAGVALHERSRARRISSAADGVVVETEAGRARAPAAVVAINAAAAGFRPLRGRLAVTSSHMLITDPVPDVLEEAGWTGGESISTAGILLHYFRTTPDGRIAFGWGGGRVAYGARLGGRVCDDAEVGRRLHADLLTYFPALRGRGIAGRWGGPIDVSPIHLPEIGTVGGGRIHYVHGFTGNGVGPTHLAGRILASLALDRRDALTRLAIVEPGHPPVPPEPLRWVGGTLVRSALLRQERREDAGLDAGRFTRAVVSLPNRLGFHVGR